MKVYTKTGDKGTTSLYGGVKVSKNHVRIDAYGTVDELNSAIGLIRSTEILPIYIEQLIKIQKDLFHVGAELATPQEKMYLANGKSRLPKLVSEIDIEQLENWIDEMEEELPPLMHFILPGGYLAASHAHLSRCICRRAERITVALNDLEEIRGFVLKYLNRLSDYLFVLARKISQDAAHEEIKWLPNE
ncbi:cob(I)yrinic acid a,c-diamide adenosyltransferase [Moheibacter sediminis]|uniref:Corrinoid adenosyltransferase n=1 Tax=Moheibacter sediminis TaxID=1434700 RepID=A0A1W1ZB47_9FLAO|nr:cob(I)yrinic acid a,c-diamide adenosyltransferase [Moheibacter sediminis]SMC45654.1 cob(I)alamin adenosyltransferase [Moheibacter sediminis]